jgi:iron donor protein CyaY
MIFSLKAIAPLENLVDQIDPFLDGNDDLYLENGVLTLELAEGPTYVINKHDQTAQLWLACPLHGALHAAYIDNQWIVLQKDMPLDMFLSETLSGVMGTCVIINLAN